jgi:hypothetical protein
MPSAEHESPIALAKLAPELVTWLLANIFDFKVPEYHHARPQATDVRVMVPRTYHADGMILYCDREDQPVLAVVLEVQRKRVALKRRTWKLYLAQLEAELDVDIALVIYCPEPPVARWYRELLDRYSLSLPLRPMIFTSTDVPIIIDANVGRVHPALVVFSAICHGGHAEVDTIFPALEAALRSLEPVNAILYYDIVLAGLPAAARARWEEFMTATVGHEYLSERFREMAAQNQEIGEARGEARAVLTVLDARGIEVPDEIRDHVLACTDLDQLETWLRRAVNATSAADVIED